MGIRFYNLGEQQKAEREKKQPMIVSGEVKIDDISTVPHEAISEYHEAEKVDEKHVKKPKETEYMLDIVDCFAIGMMVHHELAIYSHMLGMHGFEKMHKYYSKRDAKNLMHWQMYFIDMYNAKIDPEWESFDTDIKADTVKSMLEAYLKHETEKYHAIVASIKSAESHDEYYEAMQLKKEIKYVNSEIMACKKYIRLFESAEWNHAVMLEADEDVRRKYEEKMH